MSLFSDFDRYIFGRMNDFFRDVDRDAPLLLTEGQAGGVGKQLTTTGGLGRQAGILSARMDLVEKPEGYELAVELPGVRREDINVHAENGVLNLSAERKEEKREDNDLYHYSERRYGAIRRSVPLPELADENKVQAQFSDGVLHLNFGKKPESTVRKAITIA